MQPFGFLLSSRTTDTAYGRCGRNTHANLNRLRAFSPQLVIPRVGSSHDPKDRFDHHLLSHIAPFRRPADSRLYFICNDKTSPKRIKRPFAQDAFQDLKDGRPAPIAGAQE